MFLPPRMHLDQSLKCEVVNKYLLYDLIIFTVQFFIAICIHQELVSIDRNRHLPTLFRISEKNFLQLSNAINLVFDFLNCLAIRI